ncbi:hypothetical protein VOI54_02425 [Tamlana sp. 2201CG12-4]|uniref:hypothetical protein n=1 Tax=Tamlana sp. 2201CG12-4 TaxID=3112582 RepID=UPI002DBE977F|nr:hypothetical protein [Tamlana sp. 2201CG12-4]MEC3905865.1 hypothetical protein [Tamlana sp. 2201CG12-4]
MQDQNYILFESYLSNELSEDEVAAFELRLKTEPEFNQAFNTYKELHAFLEHKFGNEDASNAFQENLKKISTGYFNEDGKTTDFKQAPKTFSFIKYAIAACIVVLFGIFTFNQFSGPSYSDYAEYETISLIVRGEENDMLKVAEQAFNSGHYEKANVAFQDLLSIDKDNSELKFYYAVTNIELNNYKIADNLLDNLSKENSIYKNKALWFLALSKLKQENHEACQEILRTIPQEADDYEQAQKLIRRLD